MNVIHVYPINDLIKHDLDGASCSCGVTTEAVFRHDGSNGWLITHHSLDGREREEQAPSRQKGGVPPS